MITILFYTSVHNKVMFHIHLFFSLRGGVTSCELSGFSVSSASSYF